MNRRQLIKLMDIYTQISRLYHDAIIIMQHDKDFGHFLENHLIEVGAKIMDKYIDTEEYKRLIKSLIPDPDHTWAIGDDEPRSHIPNCS